MSPTKNTNPAGNPDVRIAIVTTPQGGQAERVSLAPLEGVHAMRALLQVTPDEDAAKK
ncbi:MAG: hypothetical protein WKF94_00780 [Solirubrobacteraceae bacterium]